jgi:hypothetical protein
MLLKLHPTLIFSRSLQSPFAPLTVRQPSDPEIRQVALYAMLCTAPLRFIAVSPPKRLPRSRALEIQKVPIICHLTTFGTNVKKVRAALPFLTLRARTEHHSGRYCAMALDPTFSHPVRPYCTT